MKAAPAADGANEGFSVLLESGRGGRTRTRDLRFWRLVAVSAMPAYLVARALCAKTAGVWTGIIPRDCLAGESCCGANTARDLRHIYLGAGSLAEAILL